MLLAEGAIAERVVRSLLAWPHTGFGTHVSRAIPVDEQTPGAVARYMARPPITPGQMLGGADTERIIYRSDAVHPRHQANFRVFDPLDFLAEVSAHIPDAHEKTTLFYGWYSNRTRGYRRQHGLLEVNPSTQAAPAGGALAPLEARRSWARLIRQVYEVDPLLCPGCGKTMRVIAVIERPAVIRRILDHLGLPTGAPSLRAPPDLPVRGTQAGPPGGRVADHPREWSSEPFFDDLPATNPVTARAEGAGADLSQLRVSGRNAPGVPPEFPLTPAARRW
jgi:hypothetical protein